MSTVEIIFEPLEKRPDPNKIRRRAAFQSSFSSTLETLSHEVRMLGGNTVILQADFKRSQIRRDGIPYADAQPRSPAVAVYFECSYGKLTYPCDTFDDWRSNVRGIALALESLRRVDRFGVSGRGQQYTGWIALPSPEDSAWRTICEAHGCELVKPVGNNAIEIFIVEAEKKTHPDKGGSAELFSRVQQARKILLKK